MPISDEMRRLQKKWQSKSGWPKRLEWLEISGMRGWVGQRFSLDFPIMAVVGENGAGKSTILQAAASVYKLPSAVGRKSRFASDFFPDTVWERITNAHIRYEVQQGTDTRTDTIRKPGERWRGNPERPERHVQYIDLSRIQPVSARTGYSKLSKPTLREVSSEAFDPDRLSRLGQIMGREYELARLSTTDADSRRAVLVLNHLGIPFSGFHGGAGESTMAELLGIPFPQYGLILIDEIETSLHPRTQRRFIKDLARLCREREMQIVLTTHSPYILDELPQEARAFIMAGGDGQRQIVYGVSPEFTMSRMDDVQQYECDLYVEDERAKWMLTEILVAHSPQQELVQRCRLIPYGASSVGKALGQMASKSRFPRPSCVFLDGDEGAAPGCIALPGDDAPERVVMSSLKAQGWLGVPSRTGRDHATFVDECERAMLLSDHHDWVTQAASHLVLGGNTLWQALCAEWAKNCLDPATGKKISQAVQDAIDGVVPTGDVPTLPSLAPPVRPTIRRIVSPVATGQGTLFGQEESVPGE
jgi:predicted ATPase